MKMKIGIIKSCNIAYIRHYGQYGISNFVTMEKLKKWAKSNDLLNENSVILGIAMDNPEITRMENCRYDACIIISKNYYIKDDYIKRRTINEGSYAIYTIEHTEEAIKNAYKEIYSKIHNQSYNIDNERPAIERYDLRLLKNNKCEICIPIA